MRNFELKNVDNDDLEDFLIKVEKSFQLNFGNEDFKDVQNFGELMDIVINKIQLENHEDCTKQQAFYKLRKSFAAVLSIDLRSISTTTLLSDLFPIKNRRYIIKNIEKDLGFKVSILKAPDWYSGSFIIILILSIVYIYWSWKIGLLGFLLSIIGLKLGEIFGKELHLKTVADIVKYVSRENYVNSRRNSTTFNRNETEALLTEWFREELCFEQE
ncbi:hypothetical protein HYN48_13900 [Flavobacterium magnum]|uniref:Uncharacterized protein n=1 Tax=Flavobacterium magnum TaxID=2162713 RepID=A0A2S0RK47_9FLAO|nr:hypothetical protein [Flavobacterium magnum]AWA31092.1 hypothetical protein HYN48_13900 [Flavobacterium magnum]